jgi:transposase
MRKTINYSDEIKEGADYLLELVKQQKSRQQADRVRFLWYLKTGEAKNQLASSKLIGMSGRQGQNLWKRYKEEGIEGYLIEDYVRNSGKLSDEQLERIVQIINSDQSLTQKQIAMLVKSEMGIDFTQAGIHYILKRLKIKRKKGGISSKTQR